MKKLPLFILIALLSVTTLSGFDTIGDDYGSEQVVQPDKLRPFNVKGEFDNIFQSSFRTSPFKDEKIKYTQGGGEARAVFCYRPSADEGLAGTIGYTHTYLGWLENPFFCQNNFNTLSLAVSGWSNRLCNWLWQGQIAMNLDLDHYTFDYYTTWDFLLWGRYTYTPCIGIHAGLLALTGMKVDRYYPIFGFDWKFRERWKLNAVFPVNLSLVYTLNRYFEVALAGRFFDSRHRAEKCAALEMAIFEYKNTGIELAINFDYCDIVFINLHAGSTFGGKLKITNRHHSDGQHLKFDAAPYVGAEASINF